MAFTFYEIISMCIVATLWNIFLFVVMIRGSPPKPKAKGEPLSICFIHPDLGLGGAEMLVVELATGLKKRGHHIEIFTSYHDKKRAFTETIDGTLDIHVHDSIIPRSIFGKFVLPLAQLRFFWTSAKLMMRHKNIAGGYDIIFVDQVSSTIPLLKFSGSKVVYYCHFPDLLLSPRTNFIKKLYRMPLDFLEEITTLSADAIFVNSHFTSGVFKRTFKRSDTEPHIIYPTVDAERISSGNPNKKSSSPPLNNSKQGSDTAERSLSGSGGPAGTVQSMPDALSALVGCRFVLSLNRYERKKNIGLAIETMALCLKQLEEKEKKFLRLVVAGGWDERLAENVEYMQELQQLAQKLEISEYVLFYKKLPDLERNALLWNCRCVLYTPENEHFGIVPVEAGVALKPVIACNSGGPLESIQHGITGYLCHPDPSEWADCLIRLLRDDALAKSFGQQAVKRAIATFSPNVILPKLETILYDTIWASHP